MAHIKVSARFLYEYTRLVLTRRQLPDDGIFIRAAYRAFLNREPEPKGFEYHRRELQRGSITKMGFLRSLVNSNEFRQFYGLPISPSDAIHQSRMLLFQQHLPPARRIVDLGGAAENHPQGALLAMGYPHHPDTVIIIDLPPTDRMADIQTVEHAQQFTTRDGIRVHYFYRSMSDLAIIRDASIDLVVSGESIEHISEADADITCQEVYRMLKPGGVFCLDTPNAALTRLQSPDELIHPEHKKEYYVHELVAKVQHQGFEVVETKGICPMPQSVASGVFNYRELVQNIGLSDQPEQSYLFFVKAVKPRAAAHRGQGT